MNFRNDEIILESDDSSCCEEDDEVDETASQSQSSEPRKKGTLNTVEDAFSLVATVETKMSEISNVLSSMDKRMAYNLRLIGSVTHECHQ